VHETCVPHMKKTNRKTSATPVFFQVSSVTQLRQRLCRSMAVREHAGRVHPRAVPHLPEGRWEDLRMEKKGRRDTKCACLRQERLDLILHHEQGSDSICGFYVGLFVVSQWQVLAQLHRAIAVTFGGLHLRGAVPCGSRLPANRGHDANVIAAAVVFQIPSWLGS
jgi:hypothetical protein